MYVMPGTDALAKGRQSWTTNSSDAEQLFTLLAHVHRAAASPVGAPIFGGGPPDGVVAYAQAFVYNGNLQNPATWNPVWTYQPDVGWYTLNWDPPTSQAAAYEFPNGDDAGFSFNNLNLGSMLLGKPSEPPRIRLNWQSKLTPVTRLDESWLFAPPKFRSTLLKAHENHGSFRTH